MTEEIDMNAVREFGKRKYPFLVRNEDFLLKLYKREVLKEQPFEMVVTVPKFVSVDKLRENVPSSVDAVTIEKGRREYQACKTCKKKVCSDPTHGGMISRFVIMMEVGDESGTVDGVAFLDAEDVDKFVSSNPKILVGVKKLNERDNKMQFFINRWFVLTGKEYLFFRKFKDFIEVQADIQGRVIKNRYDKWKELQTIDEGVLEVAEKYLITKQDNDFIYCNVG